MPCTLIATTNPHSNIMDPIRLQPLLPSLRILPTLVRCVHDDIALLQMWDQPINRLVANTAMRDTKNKNLRLVKAFAEVLVVFLVDDLVFDLGLFGVLEERVDVVFGWIVEVDFDPVLSEEQGH